MAVGRVSLAGALAIGGALLLTGAAARQATPYHVAKTYTLGGEGGWDYLALDTINHHLFIARQDRFIVVDPATGRQVGELPGMDRAHGVAFAYDAGHGFATSGGDSTVTMFDLKTLKVLGTTIAAVDDDDILYDPATKRIYTFNGDAHSSSVIDPVSGKRIGTIDLGAKPEAGATTEDGKLYANLVDAGTIAEVDAAAMKVTRTWSVAPCTSATGLAVDLAHHRLFSACRSGVMAVSDPVAGRLVTTVPIGSGVDGAGFDPATQLAFAPNGDGTLTVIHEDTPDTYTVVQTVQTMPGARTMTLDYATHTVYTASARFGPAPAATPGARRRRPPMLPGTFTLLVITP
jgi:DNA-binding beta-propeller fold protein YncE